MTRQKQSLGCLIAVEGATGSGKTYLVDKLEGLLSKKVPFMRMGGFLDRDGSEVSDITKLLQGLMRSSRFIGLPWLAETTLLLAEQAYNLEKYVLPAYRRGAVILYENYNDALVAYQLMRGRSLPISQKKLLNMLRHLVDLQNQFEYPQPDLTVYLFAPLSVACARLRGREPRAVSKRDIKDIVAIGQNYKQMYNGSKGVMRVENHAKTDLTKESQEVAEHVIALHERKCASNR